MTVLSCVETFINKSVVLNSEIHVSGGKILARRLPSSYSLRLVLRRRLRCWRVNEGLVHRLNHALSAQLVIGGGDRFLRVWFCVSTSIWDVSSVSIRWSTSGASWDCRKIGLLCVDQLWAYLWRYRGAVHRRAIRCWTEPTERSSSIVFIDDGGENDYSVCTGWLCHIVMAMGTGGVSEAVC